MKMNQVKEILIQLQELDIKLWLEEGVLNYDAPKDVMTPEIIDKIKAQKSAIIDFLQQNELETPLHIPSISRAEKLSLSFAQQGLWFIDQLEGKSPFYNMQMLFSLQGRLNISALEKAIITLIERHETLRTNFVSISENPAVIIHSEINFQLPVINLEKLANKEQELTLNQIIEKECYYEFDLEKDSLIRFTLIKTAPEKYTFIIIMHHIISDGSSLEILSKELSYLYQVYSQNKPASLPHLPRQYVDFTAWQRQYLTEKRFVYQLDYWQKQLKDVPTFLPLPTDKPRPRIQSFKGDTKNLNLSLDLTQKLKLLSQENKVTLFVTILGAFSILLSRYSNQNDLIIGTPISNRNYEEIEGIIGFFVNSLPLRITIKENTTFKDLLSQVRATVLDAYEHQDLPFEKLVQELKIERNLSYNPLFQVMFARQDILETNLQLPELNIESLDLEIKTAKFDLTLFFAETEAELKGAINFNTDLFKPITIERMIGHLQNLLLEIVTNPDSKISQLSLLTPPEKKQILYKWNDKKTDYPRNKSIHQLFEEQVEKSPNATAVILKDQILTYQQLNQKANQLAHYLQKLGVKLETFVGLYVESSLEMIIGLLAILKSGGVYVPLDSNYPQERLNFILKDTAISILLTTKFLSNKLSFNNAKIVDLSNHNSFNSFPLHNLNVTVKSYNLAYVTYTSGTTGKPKGVLIPHCGVIRLVKNVEYISFSAEDVFLQLSSFSFDAATLEIWGSLLNGCKLVMMPSSVPNLEEIANKIQTHKITTLWLTSSLFNLIVEEKLHCLEGVKQLLVGGDVLSVTHVNKAVSTLKNTTIINGYGPTENTTFTCCYSIPPKQKFTLSIPIGKPINNTQVYILDGNLQPTPIGIEGEIYTGGDGLARGYLNRPELTAERFIDNPFGEGKLYKTGDRGRYLEDGQIEFLGRIDNQVKIRGFRVELGEIEANLLQHPYIKESLVIALENQQGDKYLVAYVVIKKSQKLLVRQLRTFLAEKLPQYMIPSHFVFLDAFPLTSNGKINRQALPKPYLEANREEEFVAPRNEIEASLVEIWQEVLGIEKIGINDNFFEIGGNSILTIRLVYEIEKKLGKKVPIKSLFELLTIKNLAQNISKNKFNKFDNCDITSFENKDITKHTLFQNGLNLDLTYNEKVGILASIKNERKDENLSLLKLEKKGNIDSDKAFFLINISPELINNLPNNLSIYSLRLWTKVENPKTFIKVLATYCVREILAIKSINTYYLGGFCFGGLVALEIAQQLKQKGKNVALLTLIDTNVRQSFWKTFVYRVYFALLVNSRIILRLKSKQKLFFIFRKVKTEFNYRFNLIKAYFQKKFTINPHKKQEQKLLENGVNTQKLDQEIDNSLGQAMKYYQPIPYAGKVAIFFSIRQGKYSLLLQKTFWHNLLKSEISIDLLPGNHNDLLKLPSVKLLSKLLAKKLSQS